MNKQVRIALIAAAAAMLSAPVSAYEAGEWTFKIGITDIDPKQDNGDVVPGLQIDVGDDSQVGFTGEYMFSPELGLELLASLPFEHDISVAGVQVGSTKHLPPTLSVNYHFNSSGDFIPYVGAGVNYTNFFSQDTNGATLPGVGVVTGLDIDDSWGLALQAGVDMMVRDNTMINFSVRWVDINPDATATIANTTVLPFDVDIDPVIISLTLGWKF